ncbi:MAG: hypothetical protein M1593_04995 [Candidatus Thermoplasmatota archaeon]|nr:hypothetical protein [Candidatus Thermoplasmatota archaeon]
MLKQLTIGIVISMLMLGTASIALADSNGSDNVTGNIFTYSQQQNGNLTNVAYGTTVLASNVNATGYPVSSSSTGTVSTKTMTIFNGMESKSFLLATDHYNQLSAGKSNVTISFNLTVNASMTGKSLENLDLGDNPYGVTSSNWVVYLLDTPNLTGYLISNGNPIKTSDTQIKFYSNDSNKMTGSYPLVAGFISRGNAESLLEKYSMDHHEDKFTYNATSGNVSGSFLSFVFNSTNGNITDFTSKLANREVFSNINVSGNGTLLAQNDLPVFHSSVITVGGMFVYSNGSKLYSIHNNPTLQSSFLVYNGTMNFMLGKGLIATNFTTVGKDTNYNLSKMGSNLSYDANTTFEFDHEFGAGHNTVAISGNGFLGFLLVNNANVTIANGLLTISSPLNSTAKVSFLAPPGLQDLNSTIQNRLQYAMAHGRLAGQISINFVNSTISNLTMNLNASVNFSISSVNAGKVSFNLASHDHQGTNVAVFISNSVLKNIGNGTVYVYLDGARVSLSSYNGVVNSTSDVSASYAVIQENSGVLVIVHIPHFSNHTLVISSTAIQPSGTLTPTDYGYIAIGGVAAVIAAIGAISILRRKRE